MKKFFVILITLWICGVVTFAGTYNESSPQPATPRAVRLMTQVEIQESLDYLYGHFYSKLGVTWKEPYRRKHALELANQIVVAQIRARGK